MEENFPIPSHIALDDDFADCKAPLPEHSPNRREVNLILDHSAFTLGLGNIKRWFDKEYFRTRVSDKIEKVHLNIYVPMNTLHELALKKSLPTIASTRAKEALAFIDEVLEKEAGAVDKLSLDDLDLGSEAVGVEHGEEANETKKFKKKSKRSKKKSSHVENFLYSLILEDRAQGFLPWNSCVKFQMRSPLNREFPSYKKFISSGRFDQNDAEELDEEASISNSMKFLIRSCVSIRGTEARNNPSADRDQWRLVTEDASLKIWADCFGTDSLNINEAELLLFRGKDLGSFEVKAPGADFFSETDVYDSVTSPLHKMVNTTSYNYSSLKEETVKPVRGKGAKEQKTTKSRTAKPKRENVTGPKKENGVILEDFDMINYAPRTSSSGLISSSLLGGAKKSKQKAKS